MTIEDELLDFWHNKIDLPMKWSLEAYGKI